MDGRDTSLHDKNGFTGLLALHTITTICIIRNGMLHIYLPCVVLRCLDSFEVLRVYIHYQFRWSFIIVFCSWICRPPSRPPRGAEPLSQSESREHCRALTSHPLELPASRSDSDGDSTHKFQSAAASNRLVICPPCPHQHLYG
jgi:hypothetical protein